MPHFSDNSQPANLSGKELADFINKEICAFIPETHLTSFNVTTPLMELGLTSINLVALSVRLSDAFQEHLDPMFFFQYGTPKAITDYFNTHLPKKKLAQMMDDTEEKKSKSEQGDESKDAIAVIGMACRFPGANDYHAFWNNLVNQVNSVKEIPIDRWDWKEFYGDPKTEPDKTNVKWGGFIDDIDKFDSLFFNISPKEASYIDPQHRLFLQTAWHAMEDAGYSSQMIAGKNVGVYGGVSKNDYGELMRERHAEILPYVSTGTVHSILTNRLSYILDIHGPSESIDTACSSALVALYSAVRDIRSGVCQLAFAGGVNIIICPTMFISHSRSGMLSGDGQCKTFDENANGYVRSEGVGVLLLKPLREALKDGDSIHAIIRGSAINHGGKSTGLTAPNITAQAEVIQSALKDAKLSPEAISYIEVHGTGTPLGDPVEIEGLKKAFSNQDGHISHKKSCLLGAAKTNVGHCESASGMVGVIKTIMALKHHAIPANLNFHTLNPKIHLDDSPFGLANAFYEWDPVDSENKPILRRGGVSSFGMGGTNAHVILEEAPTVLKETKALSTKQYIPVSAKKGSLQAYLVELDKFLSEAISQHESIAMDELAYTLQTGRDAFDERIIFSVDSPKALQQKIKDYLSGNADNEARDDIEKRWMKGETIDWNAQWDIKPRRLGGIPCYPFLPTRCWFDEKKNELIHIISESNLSGELEGVQIEIGIRASQFFLKDHIVGGKSILPGVMYLEIIRNFAEKMQPGKKLCKIKNIMWLSRIEVKDELIHLAIGLAVDGLTHFKISEGGKLKCSGDVVYDDFNSNHDPVNIDQIRAECPHEKSAAEIYETMKSVGLNQGPSLKVMTEFYSGARVSLAKLKLTSLENMKKFTLHPALMDGVYQTTVAHHFSEHRNKTQRYLPYALESVEWFRPMDNEVYAYVEELPDSESEKFLKYRMKMLTLKGDVIVQFEGFIRRPADENAPALQKTGHVSSPVMKDLFYKDSWQEQSSDKNRTLSNYLLLLTSDVDFSNKISSLLPSMKIITVGLGVEYERLSDNQYAINQNNPDDFDALMQQFKNEHIIFSEIIYDWHVLDLSPILFLVQSLIRHHVYHKLLIVYLYSVTETLQDAKQAMVGGFARTLLFENPQIEIRSVETPQHSVEEKAKLAVSELLSENGGPLLEVSYQQDVRKIRKVVPAEEIENFKPVDMIIKKGGTYLMSGGAGGLGKIFSLYLAEQYQANLILIGRTPLNETIQKTLDSLKKKASSVHYLSADITNLQDLEAAFKKLPPAMQHLNGVIHAAGLKRDSFILKKENQSFREVISVKVKGALNLDALTQTMNLDFMLLFSSIASLIPNQGQSDYAAANSFLDRFAQIRNTLVALKNRHGLTLAINWPLFASGGMRVTEEQETHLKTVFGMDPLPTEQGINVFEQLLNYAHKSPVSIDQMVVISGDKNKIQKAFDGGKEPASNANTRFSPALVNVAESDIKRQYFTYTFHVDNPYIRDFSYKGRHAVPGACFIEMARQAGQMVYSNKSIISVFNNYWPVPLFIDGDSVKAELTLHKQADQHCNYELYTSTANGEKVIHGTGALSCHYFTDKPPVPDMDALIKRADSYLVKEDFYKLIHDNADLRLNDQFRPVDKLYLSQDYAIAVVKLDKIFDETMKDYVINPVIFTAIEQSILVQTASSHRPLMKQEIRCMPVYIEAVDIYQPFPNECLFYIMPLLAVNKKNKIQKFDVIVVDKNKRLIAKVTGNTMRIQTIGQIHAVNPALPSTPINNSSTDVIKELQNLLGPVLGIAPEAFDPNTSFDECGTDSVMIMQLNAELEKKYGPVSKTLFFEYQNLNELSQYFLKMFPENYSSPDNASIQENSQEPVKPVAEPPKKAIVLSNKSAIKALQEIFSPLLGLSLDQFDPEVSFESYGINSVMIMQLNAALEKKYGPVSKTLFFEYQNLNELGDYLVKIFPDQFSPIEEKSIKKTQPAPLKMDGSKGTTPFDLYPEASLGRHIALPDLKPQQPPQNLFLTGATGGLGSHLLYQCAMHFKEATFYCLVRASSIEQGYQRIYATLKKRGISDDFVKDRVIPVLGDLALPLLGMNGSEYKTLAEKIDSIFHCGAETNWSYHYKRLKPANVDGTLEIIKFSLTERQKIIHHISTMAVLPFFKNNLYHQIDDDFDILHKDPLYLPYFQSKWVSEMQMHHAREWGLKVNIYRPGSLVCDLRHGIPVPDELSYRIVEGCRQLGYAPDIKAEISLTPLDVTAEIIAYIAQHDEKFDQNYNIVNDHKIVIKDILTGLTEKGYPIQFVSVETWLQKLRALDVKHDKNPILPVLDTALNLFLKHDETRKLCTNTIQGISGSSIHFPVPSQAIIDAYVSGMIREISKKG